MSDAIIHDDPSTVKAGTGKVVITGPDHVDVSLTPDAAVKTSARLIDAAAEAKGKKDIQADIRRRRQRRVEEERN